MGRPLTYCTRCGILQASLHPGLCSECKERVRRGDSFSIEEVFRPFEPISSKVPALAGQGRS